MVPGVVEVIVGGVQGGCAFTVAFTTSIAKNKNSDPFTIFENGNRVIPNGGQYYLTVTDNVGCTGINSSLVHLYTNPSLSVVSTPNPVCVGNVLSLTSGYNSGGTPPLTYSWSGPNSFTSTDVNPEIDNVTTAAAGVYTVTATDSHGCIGVGTSSAISAVSNSVTLVTSGDVTICPGGPTTLTSSGASTYDWNPTTNLAPTTGNNVSATPTSDITYTVTGHNGNCYDKKTIHVSMLPQYPVTASAASNGTISETGVTNICQGTDHTYIVTPASGYHIADVAVDGSSIGHVPPFVVHNVLAPRTINASFAPDCTAPSISCTGNVTHGADAGACNAVVTYSAATAGGTSPTITYSQNSGTAFSVGVTTVTATATNTCGTASCNFLVTVNPNTLSVSASHTNATCYNGHDGTITTTVSGGSGSYAYSWTGGATGANPTALGAGTYTVTVTDNNCSAVSAVSATVTITQPTVVTPVATAGTIACNGETTVVTVTATGGSGTYTSGTGDHTVTAGDYGYTVTDNHGCTGTVSVTVTEPDPVTISAAAGTIACNGQTTTIVVTGAGGTSPLTGVATYTVSAGTYDYTVTDAHTCSATTTVTVTQPDALAVNGTVTNVNCHGNTTGSITTSVSGGTTPYSYSWSTGATTSGLSAKAAGTYTVTVTDGNLCTTTASYTITQPDVLSVSGTMAGVDCNGNSTGSISTTVSGGTPGYSYSWSNSAITANISALAAGTYTVTVTDANLCTASTTKTVTEPAVFTATATAGTIACHGGSTTIVVAGSGGTTPLPAVATYTVTAGTYNYSISDGNGCPAAASATIANPATLILSATTNNIGCTGGSTGSITTTTSGGTTPYAYSWSNGATTSNISSLAAGTYSVTVTDHNACTATGSGTISNNSISGFSGTTANVSCHGGNNGSVTTTVSGGNSPYTYSWSNGANTASVSGLTAATYTVSVTDAGGCSATGSYTITQPTTVSVSGTITNENCNAGTNGSVTTSVSGGTSGYTYSWSTGATTASITNKAQGTYTVTVTDANLCTATASYTITQPTALSVSGTVTNENCNGGNNGSVTANPSGGTSGYTYSWSTGATTASITSKTAATYTVTVTDAKLCTTTGAYTITQPTALSVSGTITNESCSGGTTGSVTTTVSGGTSGYTYSWSTGATTSSITGKAAGTYTVTVTDVKSCTTTGVYTITQPAVVTSTITGSSSTLGGVANTYTGPSGLSSYTWSVSGTGASISGSSTGSSVSIATLCSSTTYTVTLTTSNGSCSSTSTLHVSVTQSTSITVYSSLYTTGSGEHPTTTKTALASNLKVFDRSTCGSRDYDQSHYSTKWNGTSGLVTNVSITGPTTVTIGGGPADQYMVTVPANGEYLIIGQSIVSSTKCGGSTCTVYEGSKVGSHISGDGDDHEDEESDDGCSTSIVRFTEVMKDDHGNCTEGRTEHEYGSHMLILSPANLVFTDSEKLLPVIYESVAGDWSVSVTADPPSGFYATPGDALSTSVTDATLSAVQFSLADTGSEWTFTKLTHQIMHKGEPRTAHSSPKMVNERTNKPSELNVSPNPANDQIKIVLSKFEGKATIYIYNSLGQKVAEQPINIIGGTSVSMDISALPAGIYFVTAQNSYGKATSKLIKAAN